MFYIPWESWKDYESEELQVGESVRQDDSVGIDRKAALVLVVNQEEVVLLAEYC